MVAILFLRIEDTDQNRYVDGAEQYIIDSLIGAEFLLTKA